MAMAVSEARLWAIMYHYVRNTPRTRFPRIKGLSTRDFASQVETLARTHELASLESALAFLDGTYKPRRDLYLLTFDDGVKDHYTDVLPILSKHGIQGLFFLITGCIEDHKVAAVHKNHFLMAALDFPDYQSAFMERLHELSSETDTSVDTHEVSRTYRWDSPEVATFKYLLNFRLPGKLRDQVLDSLFTIHLGSELEFARELYITWEEARQMQSAGMLLGGHSHHHLPLGRMDDDRQISDLVTCARLLHQHLLPQPLWPFSYPYGKTDSFNQTTIRTIHQLEFACSFATEIGPNVAGGEPFAIKRIDPKDVTA
jgi:peptidoglycan/xylan/chitin deacetylase (PgdA/CDA1 family)